MPQYDSIFDYNDYNNNYNNNYNNDYNNNYDINYNGAHYISLKLYAT